MPALTAQLEAAAASERQAHVLRFAKVVGGGPPPRPTRSSGGDTLSGIAERKLAAARWRDILTLNRDILTDPDEVTPGQELVLLKR